MGKKRRIFFLALMLASLGTMAWVLLRPSEPEPVYQGKPLSYWLEGYLGPPRANSNGPPALKWADADNAVTAMGTNAVPGLMRMVQRHDSQWKITIYLWLLHRHLMKSVPGHFFGNDDWKAARGLNRLGPTASNAVPQLIRMFERDPSAFAQATVPGILGTIGRPALPAAAVLLQHGITHTNAIVRANSIYALRSMMPDATLVVPALIKCLSDPDPLVRGQAVRTLQSYGEDARVAVPELMRVYHSEPQPPSQLQGPRRSVDGAAYTSRWMASPLLGTAALDVRGLARDALWKIDREAAEKAGVK